MHFTSFSYLPTTDSCVKCGKCIPSCTIFSINGDEVTSPRGFIDLLGAYERGNLPLDKNAKNIFESCFLCNTCVSVCPNVLPTDELIENIRYEIAQKFGIARFKKIIFYLLKNRKVMDRILSFGSIFVPILFKTSKDSSCLIPRIKLPFLKNRVIANIQKESFLASNNEEIIKKDSNKKVAIFIGCLVNNNYKSVGDSLLFILEKLQINIKIAKSQKCCGAPMYFTGDFHSVDSLIRYNVEYFESFIDEVEAILIPEATCAAMMIEDWERFMKNDEEMKNRIKKLKPKFQMATKYLLDNTNLITMLEQNATTEEITYHDPCHSRKVLGIYKEPRTLLSKAYKIIEMEDSSACCGFGGVTIQSEKFELARKVGSKKAKMIEKTKAKYVSAECSACRMQLTNVIHNEKIDITFLHPLELIAKALRQ